VARSLVVTRTIELIALAAVVAASVACASNTASWYVEPATPRGLALQRTAAQVEKRVLRGLDPGARIETVSVLARRDQLWRAIPSLGRPVGRAAHGGPVWLVHAYGHFQLVSVPPGGKQLTKPRSGWVAVDDRTGVTLAYGF
jgi:hypothetical protein